MSGHFVVVKDGELCPGYVMSGGRYVPGIRSGKSLSVDLQRKVSSCSRRNSPPAYSVSLYSDVERPVSSHANGHNRKRLLEITKNTSVLHHI